MVYLPTFAVDFFWDQFVGKYTIPMDASWDMQDEPVIEVFSMVSIPNWISVFFFVFFLALTSDPHMSPVSHKTTNES